MKTLMLISLVTIFIIGNAFGASWTVNNNPGGPGQFLTVDDAIAAASNGDTIYITGSASTNYFASVTKSLTFIGPGINPDKEHKLVMPLAGQFFIGPGSEGSSFNGLRLSIFRFDGFCTLPIANITIRNCEFSGFGCSTGGGCPCNSSFDNWIIENNVIRGGYFSFGGANNIVIQNNVFTQSYIQFGAPLSGSVNHNIFIAPAGSGSAFNGPITNAVISNNIFYNVHPNVNTVGCTFLNNLSYNSAGTYPVFTGTGNIDNQDPLFVNFPAGGSGFDPTHDYHLQAGSPAIGAASDGSDIGIYGGLNGFTMNGEGPSPVMRKMDISNLNVPQSGTVDVHIRATKPRGN